MTSSYGETVRELPMSVWGETIAVYMTGGQGLVAKLLVNLKLR